MYTYNLGNAFCAVVSAHGERVALRYAETSYTYAELSAMAEQSMQLLLNAQCRQGDVIAIAHTKAPQSYALMLAALMLGMPYVNIDVSSPAARTMRILQTSQPKILCYDSAEDTSAMQELAKQHGCPALSLMDIQPHTPRPSAEALATFAAKMAQVDGATLAYIMFTSGSTGTPKGVAISHENLTHFIAWAQSCFSIRPEDIFAQISPMYFDNSVFDFYTALFCGASLAPIARPMLTAPLDLVAHIEQMQCSIWFSVPSLLMYLMTMKVLSPARLPAIRSFSFGGEGYPKVELKKLYDHYSSRARIVNVYGPTECTCICSAYDLTDTDFEDVEGLPTLGQLNQNFDYLILDHAEQESTQGELCLLGPNVASGYFNDPERTAAAFFTLQSPERYGKRMYKTGDIIRQEEGKLYFVGRKDNQIKHMGYRIELEEIEHALISLANIDQAAVIYERSQALYGRIVAYVASKEQPDTQDILTALKDLLPAYMLPNKVHVLESLPKNANGKVDKHALKN